MSELEQVEIMLIQKGVDPSAIKTDDIFTINNLLTALYKCRIGEPIMPETYEQGAIQ